MDNLKKKNDVSINHHNDIMQMVGYICDEDGDASNYISPEAVDDVEKIRQLISAAFAAIKSKNNQFKAEKIGYKYSKIIGKEKIEYRENKSFAPPRPEDYFLRASPLGSTIRIVLNSLSRPEYREFLDGLALEVEISTFVRVAYDSGIVDQLKAHREKKALYAQVLAKKLNDFVDQVRAAAKTKEFKQAVNSNNRRVNKNTQSVEKFLAWSFECHSRLLVIRLDLGYRRPDGMGQGEFARHISEERAKKDLEVFLKKNAPHGLFTHMVGYVVKMEMAPYKGLHFHVLMLFDGRHHREDITIAATLGQYWVEITGRDGLFFNCNQKWHGKPQCAVGMIHRNDQEKRTALKERVVPYLTKMDRYFQFLPRLTDRTLRRSQIRWASQPKGNDGAAEMTRAV
ncbi:inovirus-type Gp2 protein [Chromobacterium violaceum]|nr:inovirus-type Gp2 protein [Chromobacterium violaceum]